MYMNPISASVLPSKTPQPGSADPLRAVARDLQGVFFHQMLKVMRESVPQDGLISGGFGGETFTAMFDERMAQVMSSRTNSPLEEAIYRQLQSRLSQSS